MEATSITQVHKDNDTPLTSDEGIKRMDKDTPFHGDSRPGASATEGPGAVRPHEDPKSAGTPVHRAPSEDSPAS